MDEPFSYKPRLITDDIFFTTVDCDQNEEDIIKKQFIEGS